MGFLTSDPLQDKVKEWSAPPPKGHPYSVPIPGSEREGRSAVYRHWKVGSGPLLDRIQDHITTVHESFEDAVKKHGKSNCLGYRPYDPASKTYGQYVWQDYETVNQRRKRFGAGLVQLHRRAGITEQKHGVGLWCQNRPEWQITDLGCMSQALYTVSLYDTLGPDTTEFIINHASLPTVVTSLNHVAMLLKLKPRLPALKVIVCLDPLSGGELPGESKGELLNEFAKAMGVSIYSMQEVEDLGEKEPIPLNPPTPEDICTINYTSGTTGDPKGVVLSHANMVAGTSAAYVVVGNSSNDVLCSFLPLAHIYQRLGEEAALGAGGAIGYFHGNILELVDDMKLLRPTTFPAVPRLFNRFGTAIKEATVQQGGIRGALSRHVVSTKLANINDPVNPTNKHALYDRIWSRKVIANFGLDRCRVIVSGSAPLDPSLHQFLRIVFCNRFLQGYGLTETTASTLGQLEGDLSAGNCGAVLPSGECCLADVPDMDYLTTDKPYPRGELLTRATSQFKRYFRNDAETEKAVDADGWFHTGDIAEVDELGRFKIIDRKKNVLKLAQGEYISPERIENVYLANCGWMATAYVHGDSTQAFLVALFGIAPEGFAAFASKVLGEEVSPTDMEKLQKVATMKKVEKAALKELEKVGRKNKFNSYERVRNVRLLIDPFTVENQLITPTLKLKRPQIAKMYRTHLDDMYAESLEEEQNAKVKAKL